MTLFSENKIMLTGTEQEGKRVGYRYSNQNNPTFDENSPFILIMALNMIYCYPLTPKVFVGM